MVLTGIYNTSKRKIRIRSQMSATLTVETHSMVVLPDPGENLPSMKIPQGKLDFPW